MIANSRHDSDPDVAICNASARHFLTDSAQKKRHLPFFVLLAAVFLAGCTKSETPEVHQERIVAFGTLVDISIYGASDDVVGQASEQLHTEFNRLHSLWHAWQDGELHRANLLIEKGLPATVSPETMTMLRQAQAVSSQTSHLFNPAIGGLIRLWGFHADDLPTGPPPSPDQIKALLKFAWTLDDLALDGNEIKPHKNGIIIDVGAFAKGYVVDRGIEVMRKLGIENAIINAGGDLRAIGSKGGVPWRVGVRHPRENGLLAAINIAGDESVFTSGDYERFYTYRGSRMHHIIDPRNGYPAGDTTSVTIIHDDAATADAAATALFIAGPSRWTAIAKGLGLKYVMLVDKELNVYLSPAMAERVEFQTESPPVTVIENID